MILNDLFQQYNGPIQNIEYLLLFINSILHLLFAGAVARDAGNLNRLGLRPALVSGPTWAFATLLGGVITAAIYWFIHHSTLTRPISGETRYDKP